MGLCVLSFVFGVKASLAKAELGTFKPMDTTHQFVFKIQVVGRVVLGLRSGSSVRVVVIGLG
jgi:hypothetical protein